LFFSFFLLLQVLWFEEMVRGEWWNRFQVQNINTSTRSGPVFLVRCVTTCHLTWSLVLSTPLMDLKYRHHSWHPGAICVPFSTHHGLSPRDCDLQINLKVVNGHVFEILLWYSIQIQANELIIITSKEGVGVVYFNTPDICQDMCIIITIEKRDN